MKVFERATSEDKAVPTALSNRLLSLDVYDTPQNLDRRSRCKIAAVQRGENDGQTAKRQLPELFSRSGPQTVRDDEELKAQLYQQIGQLKVELDWRKKKVGSLS